MEAGSRIALDTDVLVGSLRGKNDVLQTLTETSLATTVVNAFELFHGAYKSRESASNVPATSGLLSSLEVLGMDLGVAERAGEVLAQLQKGRSSIDIRDLLVGCIAREQGYALMTNNVRHLRRIPGLRVIPLSSLST
jgi:tRNA(fMet)-specific endonuclease VapC